MKLDGIFDLFKVGVRGCIVQWRLLFVQKFDNFITNKAGKHKKFLALAGSLGLHLLFVLFLLMRAPVELSDGGHSGQGGAPGDGVAVTLVDGEELNREMLTVKPASEDRPEDKVVPLDVAQFDAPLVLTETTFIPQVLIDPSTESQPDTQQDAGRAGSEGDGGAGISGDDLWGAIAPCWNRLADANTMPVTLEVSFGPDGGIASPPVIDASADDQKDPRAERSEAIAMQALAQCGAYAMVENRQDVKVNFPRP